MKTEEILADWPEVFDRMYISSDCPSGWNALITHACYKLATIVGDKRLEISQVKEKFGGLRFSIDFNPSEFSEEQQKSIYAYVRWAEDASWHVCQDCGARGKQAVDEGWCNVQCDRCKGA